MADAKDNRADSDRFAFVARHRLSILLAAMVLLMLVAPFLYVIVPGEILERTLVTALFVAVLLSAVWVVSRTRTAVIIATLLGAPAIVLKGLHVALASDGVGIAMQLFAIAFLAYAIVAILRVVFTDQRVTYNTIAAALCVYLLLSILWASVYAALEIVEPGSFSLTAAETDLIPSAESPDEFSRQALYYSLVTMTTLGYGDIAPKTPPARMFAAMQAVMGQIYLAVLVARLVGLHIVHAREKDRDAGS